MYADTPARFFFLAQEVRCASSACLSIISGLRKEWEMIENYSTKRARWKDWADAILSCKMRGKAIHCICMQI